MAAHHGCAIYTIAENTIVLLLGAGAFFAFLGGHELREAFALGIAVFCPCAITSFIGLSNGWEDVSPALTDFARRAPRTTGQSRSRQILNRTAQTADHVRELQPNSRWAWRAYACAMICRE